MTSEEARRLSPPIGDRDHAQGPLSASLTLVEYGDYECPYCRTALPIVTGLREVLGERLLFVYRHFPNTSLHPHAQHAAEAAEAAGAQGFFWEMHAYLFDHQQALDDEHLVRYASDLGLDADRFGREMTGHLYAARVRRDFSSGVESGVEGTPTFYLDGVRYDEPIGLRQLLATIGRTHPEIPQEAADQVQQLRIPRVVGQRSPFRPAR